MAKILGNIDGEAMLIRLPGTRPANIPLLVSMAGWVYSGLLECCRQILESHSTDRERLKKVDSRHAEFSSTVTRSLTNPQIAFGYQNHRRYLTPKGRLASLGLRPG